MIFFYLDPYILLIFNLSCKNGLLAQSEHVKQWLLNETTILSIINAKFFFFFFFFLRYKSILFFMLVYVLKKKREHATYDIRDSYYKPVAPALCWCNPPGSAPSHRTGLEPGFLVRDVGALTRNAKGYSL